MKRKISIAGGCLLSASLKDVAKLPVDSEVKIFNSFRYRTYTVKDAIHIYGYVRLKKVNSQSCRILFAFNENFLKSRSKTVISAADAIISFALSDGYSKLYIDGSEEFTALMKSAGYSFETNGFDEHMVDSKVYANRCNHGS